MGTKGDIWEGEPSEIYGNQWRYIGTNGGYMGTKVDT